MGFEQSFSELHISSQSPASYVKPHPYQVANLVTTEMRLKRIAKRQMDSATMFSRLQVIIDQMEETFRASSSCNQVSPTNHIAGSEHNYAYTNSSSGVSSTTSSPSTGSPASSVDEQQQQSPNAGNKRKLNDEDYQQEDAYPAVCENSHPAVVALTSNDASHHHQYPQQIGEVVILGPNGTQIDARSYSSIIWSSSASATRQLLGFVFSSDVLATHTLTGKPSPAFYGRERPAKMQLDPIKAADIIHCVKTKFHCTEREIRAAITTKCSDTSKKYKRRSLKQIDAVNKM
ncbi:early boundary activity protein 2-like [Musca vetustissima]|uniref:early boundary activity protein 2-like n=1 Tax=Musca vetustissima TaxID=27455 RepID=UPI002AB6F6DE|nr:early boundary activity protein 2-like [Musca vetustissima]